MGAAASRQVRASAGAAASVLLRWRALLGEDQLAEAKQTCSNERMQIFRRLLALFTRWSSARDRQLELPLVWTTKKR